jgi:hypothetical protein
MPVRAAMADLIDQVERLVNDTANAFWSTQQIQDALDRNRVDIHQLPLGYLRTGSSTGIQYLTFYVGDDFMDRVGAWEADAVIYSNAYAVLTPGTINYLTGTWTFASTQSPPLYITGATYDLFGAAAWLLHERLANVAPNYDFSAAGQSFSASQEFTAWANLLKLYQSKMRPRSARLVRTDTLYPVMSTTISPRYSRNYPY